MGAEDHHRDRGHPPSGRGGSVAPWRTRSATRASHGHLGFGVAARSIYLRFSHHNMPIASIVQLFKVEGLPVSEEVLHTLYDVTADRVDPMYLAILENLCKSKPVDLDDTTALVLDLLHPADVPGDGDVAGHRDRREADT